MNKKLLVQILVSAQYVFLVSATAAVLTFQFVPNLYCDLTALICYTLGFMFMSARAITNLIELAVVYKKIKQEESALVVEGSKEVLSKKSEMGHAVLSCVVWLTCFAFSLAVLIAYVISL